MHSFVQGIADRLVGPNRTTRFMRLREAVAETGQPALLRTGGTTTGTPNDGGASTATNDPTVPRTTQCPSCKGSGIKGSEMCPRCVGAGTIPTGGEPATILQESTRPAPAATPQLVHLTSLHKSRPVRLREADSSTGPIYEVELIAEGKGNECDRVFYTKAALREASSSGVLSGMQAYANHPGKDEELNRPERDVRQLVGYYRGFKFKESGSKGRPVVAAELVCNQGESNQWFVDLMESAISAKTDGVELCGISLDGGGLVELGEVDGQYMNVCRQITEAPSADIVTRPAAGGTIVRRLRESVQRAQSLPHPQETSAMKIADLKTKLGTVHTQLREAVAKLTVEGATDEQVAEALSGLTTGIGEVETLAGTEVEAEVQIREAAVGDKTATALAAEKAELEVKLREAESKVTDLTSKNTSLERSMLAAQALREAEVPADQAKDLFGDLVKLDSIDAMKGAISSRKEYEEHLFERFRESVGIGAVEGVPARLPLAAPSTSGDPLADLGIPTLPTPEPAATAAA